MSSKSAASTESTYYAAAVPKPAQTAVQRNIADQGPSGQLLKMQRSVGNRVTQMFLDAAFHDQGTSQSVSPPNLSAFQVADSVLELPLAEVLGKVESLTGRDLSSVQVHTASPIASTAGVEALACGHQVHLSPMLSSCPIAHQRRVLGHELAHVVQQDAGRAYPNMPADTRKLLEREADEVALTAQSATLTGERPLLPLSSSVLGTVQRFDSNQQSGTPAAVQRRQISEMPEPAPAGETTLPMQRANSAEAEKPTESSVRPTGQKSATKESIKAEIKDLDRFKPTRKLKYFVEGKYYDSNDLELSAEDHATVLARIRSIRAEIDALVVSNGDLKSEVAAKKNRATRGELYRMLAEYAPFAFQMANEDILFNIQQEKKKTRLQYHHAGPRTCNITVLSMALEGLGISAGDFTGDVLLLQAIIDAQQEQSPLVKWAVDPEGRKKHAMSAQDEQLHNETRTHFKDLKVKSLRFADFMQFAIQYYYLTSSDILKAPGDEKVSGLGMPVDRLKILSKEAPKEFLEKLTAAADLAAMGVTVSANFKYFAARLFGGIGTNTGGEKHQAKGNDRTKAELKWYKNYESSMKTHARETAKAQKSGLPLPAPFVPPKNPESPESFAKRLASYKQYVLTTIVPLLEEGYTIEINHPGHFIYLAKVVEAEGIVVKDVGHTGGKHEMLPWSVAYQEGWLSGFVAYNKDEQAASALDKEQAERQKKFVKD